MGDLNTGFGIGEYTQVLARAGSILPFWADGRSNDGDLEIFTARIPIENSPMVGATQWATLQTTFQVKELFPNPVRENLVLAVSRYCLL